MSYIHFLSKIFLMIKWSYGFFIFMWHDDCINNSKKITFNIGFVWTNKYGKFLLCFYWMQPLQIKNILGKNVFSKNFLIPVKFFHIFWSQKTLTEENQYKVLRHWSYSRSTNNQAAAFWFIFKLMLISVKICGQKWHHIGLSPRSPTGSSRNF